MMIIKENSVKIGRNTETPKSMKCMPIPAFVRENKLQPPFNIYIFTCDFFFTNSNQLVNYI